jgi:hypothetical protein
MDETVQVCTAKAVTQADGSILVIDARRCLGGGHYPCPGCPNCDRFVEMK